MKTKKINLNYLSLGKAVLIAILSLIVVVSITFIGLLVGLDENQVLLFGNLIALIIVLLLIKYFVVNHNYGLQKFSLKEIVFSILAGIAVAAIYLLIFADNNSAHTFNIYSLFGTVFFGVFYEEIVFRHIILKGLLERYSAFISVLISSLLFVAIHIDLIRSPVQMVAIFSMSIASCLMYYKTRNLTNSIVIHSSYNMGVLFFPHLI